MSNDFTLIRFVLVTTLFTSQSELFPWVLQNERNEEGPEPADGPQNNEIKDVRCSPPVSVHFITAYNGEASGRVNQ